MDENGRLVGDEGGQGSGDMLARIRKIETEFRDPRSEASFHERLRQFVGTLMKPTTDEVREMDRRRVLG